MSHSFHACELGRAAHHHHSMTPRLVTPPHWQRMEHYTCASTRLPPPLPQFGFSEHEVPQLQRMSEVLTARTGWTIRPVAGLMHPRDFLAGLAFKVGPMQSRPWTGMGCMRVSHAHCCTCPHPSHHRVVFKVHCCVCPAARSPSLCVP